jgi:hypothetical protein
MHKMNGTINIPDEVIRRFAYKHNIVLSEARSLFQELEIFLDSTLTSSHSPTKIVDEAWHEFILHTKIYAEYCNRRYGRFIHHVPSSRISNEVELATGRAAVSADTNNFCNSRVLDAVNSQSSSLVPQKRFSITENGACSSDCEPSP